MVHSRVAERPRPGKRKPIMGDRYSQATASAHSASRVSSCDRPPAIHRTADTHSQASMRRKLGESGCDGPRCSTMNSVRPTWITT